SVVLGVTAADRADNVDELTAQARGFAPMGPEESVCAPGSPALVSNACTQIDDNARQKLTFQAAAIGTGIAGGLLLVGGVVALALPTGNDAVEMGVHVDGQSATFRFGTEF